MGKVLKDIAKISSATIGSRVLGLLRDAATMAYLSIGAVSAAYTFAFTLPNLFRRLLGEGALISALVPVFTKTLNDDGKEAAFDFLNKVLTRAFALLSVLVAAGILLCAAFLAFSPELQQRFELGAKFSIILLPYMLLICIAAVFSAALNVLGSFGVPSVGPMLLNISIIGGLFAGVWAFGEDKSALAYSMCASWLVGGLLQAALPAYWLRKKGWRFHPNFGKSDALNDLYKLFLPALLGAAIIQLNIFVSKILALFINDAALPSVYLSGRILEFPLGVFAVAIATVYFPKLSKLNSPEKIDSFKAEYSDGLVFTMCISIPATVGIALLSREIISLLFQWGMFNAHDVSLCVPVLSVSILGLPAFAFVGFATRGFHALKDMRTPVKTSAVSFAVNFAASLILMNKFGAAGLAAANVVAALAQSVLLNRKIKSDYGNFKTGMDMAKIIAASATMGIFVLAARFALYAFLDDEKLVSATACALVIPIAAAIYFCALKLLKFDRLDGIANLALKKLGKIKAKK